MFDFEAHLANQRFWSEFTFGPGDRHEGIIDHIKKELDEIAADPSDLTEWIDVVILALDGAWRSAGANPDEIIAALVDKQARNELREWPDWRTADPGKAIEHVR
jgi:hypothetical protein